MTTRPKWNKFHKIANPPQMPSCIVKKVSLFSFFYFCYHGASWRPFVFSHFSTFVIMELHGDHLSFLIFLLLSLWKIVETIYLWSKVVCFVKLRSPKVYWNLGVFLVILESPWQVQFNKVYSTIFRAIVWKILIFEWILLLKIQKIYKNWVWKEKSVSTWKGISP